MKKALIILMLTAGCKKEDVQPIQPAPQHGKWLIHVCSGDTIEYKINFYSSIPPYMMTTYTGTKSLIEVETVVGETCGVQYRDVDSIKIISHAITDTSVIYDTIPATKL